ncbi:alpha-tectorin-like [Crassostrea virginica]
MMNTSDENPFKNCVDWMTNSQEPDGDNPFSSCLIDACNNEGTTGLQKIVCSALEEFEEQCVENGYAPPENNNWRMITSCALPADQKCQENEEYLEDGSGCPNTCQSPKAEETCIDPDIAGCHCKKGFVREGDKCVPFSSCGCMMLGRYYPQGKAILSKNCKKRYSCELFGTAPKTVKTTTSCTQGETCLTENGVGKCEKKEKCKTLEKVIACSSGNKKGSGKFTCNPQLPGNIDNVGIKLIKNQEGSTGCVKSKSFRMVKRNRQWKVQVSQGCKGVFAFTYEKKGRISSV